MTGTEWEEKFRAEHGRLPKRDEYQAAMARDFEESPLETLSANTTNIEQPRKRPAGKHFGLKGRYQNKQEINKVKAESREDQNDHKGWLGRIGVACVAAILVLGVGISLANHYQHLKKTGPETSMTISDNKTNQALSASSAKADSEKKQAAATSASSTQQLKARDLSRIDQAYILTDVIVRQAHWQAKNIKAVSAKVKGNVRTLTFTNHDQETVSYVYQLTKEATVATGRYTVNGKNGKALTVNFTDWLKDHQLADLQTRYGTVALD